MTAGFSHNHNISRKTNFQQGFAHFDCFPGDEKVTHYPDVSEMVEAVEDWLDDQELGRKFLYLQPMNVHGPYKVPPAHRDDLLGRDPDPDKLFRYYKGPMGAILKERDLAAREEVSEAYLSSLIDKYDTSIRYLTDQLVHVFELLKERDMWEDTLVIVTADHGEELFEHGGFSHGYSLHQETLHVPLLIKVPEAAESQRVKERVSNMDVLPTVLDYLGLPVPADLDGRSLVPLLRDERPEEEPGSRTHYFNVQWDQRCVASAILEWPWKLIHVESNYEGLTEEYLLYDLARDPGETQDLSGSEPDRVQRMAEELAEAMARYESEGLPEPENVEHLMDPAVLRALGYAGD